MLVLIPGRSTRARKAPGDMVEKLNNNISIEIFADPGGSNLRRGGV